MASGGYRPSWRPSMRTPIRRSGSAMRPIGRPAIDWSPVSTVSHGRLATQPESSRMPVPELPTSITRSGSRSWSAPPSTVTVPSGSVCTPAPKAAMAAAVWTTSSPRERPRMRLRPLARAASSKARWDTDLSPGTRSRPWRPPRAGSTRSVVTTAASFPLFHPLHGKTVPAPGEDLPHDRDGGGGDHEHQDPPAALDRVGDLEVVDVDAQLPQEGGDLGQRG